MTQEREDLIECYEYWDNWPIENRDWADNISLNILEEFINIDGHANWNSPGPNLPAIGKMIARALRNERERK